MTAHSSRTRRRALYLLLAFGAVLVLTLLAQGHKGPVAYGVTVEDEYGHALRSFEHRGRTYVLGQRGDRYVVRVHNHTSRRVEAVVTVDGRDVVSGGVGDYTRQRGMVIEPYASITMRGFRTSMNDVAAFRFTSPGASYSARMGTPEHVGVIGAAFFAERTAPRPVRTRPLGTPPTPRFDDYEYGEYEQHDRSERAPADAPESAAPAPSRRKASRPGAHDGRAHAPPARRYNLGTEYGERTASRVYEVEFRREHRTRPSALVTVNYDDTAGLEARGIRVRMPRIVDPRPQPFAPAPFPDSRFAPPPP